MKNGNILFVDIISIIGKNFLYIFKEQMIKKIFQLDWNWLFFSGWNLIKN